VRDVGARHSVALLFIDLDHFKAVNDTLGHELGDKILITVAERIAAVVRPGDTVARFGGDEFVVLCERLDRPEDAVVIAHRIDAVLHEPMGIDDREMQLGVSIGISYADDEDRDPSAILRDADTAMYRAKASGRGRWVVFDDALREHARDRQRIETALRSSRHGEGLELHYQPVVHLPTRRIIGVETLLRWRHGGALMSPAEFVPIAEETGLIVPIGNWVLETASAQVAAWQRLPGWERLRLSVNVSARQLGHAGFASIAAGVTSGTGMARDTLWLEITESVLLDDVDDARERLERLRTLGVRIALDDFGTGYSSLTYLRHFPVDAVKLDRSFVAGVQHDVGDAAIVSAIVHLATALGKECVAEGIEHEGQLASLLELGCSAGQGYLFSAPLPAAELGELLRSTTR
jgi:diguanylate cyclase (GGDEF)-like protein